jgi:hypothetical protein
MRLHVDGDVEIALPSAMPPGMSHVGDAQPRAFDHARRHRDRHRFGAHVAARSGARGAALRSLSAAAVAGGACLGEHHVSARPLHLARTVARRALALRRADRSAPEAAVADALPRDHDLTLAAMHRFLERDGQRRVQIRSRLRPSGIGRRHRMQDFGEQLGERRRLRAVRHA